MDAGQCVSSTSVSLPLRVRGPLTIPTELRQAFPIEQRSDRTCYYTWEFRDASAPAPPPDAQREKAPCLKVHYC
jgi:hypothetical protein